MSEKFSQKSEGSDGSHVPITKALARRSLSSGDVYDVTNHYIDVEDHPCFGTVRREIGNVNTSSWGWLGHDLNGERLMFSRYSFTMNPVDGEIKVYGHPREGDLFLTLSRRVDQEEPQTASHDPYAKVRYDETSGEVLRFEVTGGDAAKILSPEKMAALFERALNRLENGYACIDCGEAHIGNERSCKCATLCAECGESLIFGVDEADSNDQGEDIHASCKACDEDPDGLHFVGCGHAA